MRMINASMVSGLPEPASAEAQDWIRDALAALQARDQRPDVDLNGVEQRLADLERRPVYDAAAVARLLSRIQALEAAAPIAPDLAPLLARLNAVEARLAALEQAPSPQIVERIEFIDPDDPAHWDSLEVAKARLMAMVSNEAAGRLGHSRALYERMVELDARKASGIATDDNRLELMQHESWAEQRAAVEAARQEHVGSIEALTSLEAAKAYDWRGGWPGVLNV